VLSEIGHGLGKKKEFCAGVGAGLTHTRRRPCRQTGRCFCSLHNSIETSPEGLNSNLHFSFSPMNSKFRWKFLDDLVLYSARSNSHRGASALVALAPGRKVLSGYPLMIPCLPSVTTESFARGEISLLSLTARSPGAGLSLVALRSISLQIRFRCLLIQSLIQASHKTINNNASPRSKKNHAEVVRRVIAVNNRVF